MRLSEDVLSISEADSAVFHLDKDQSYTTKNPSILEFQFLYGLIRDRISCGIITFDKTDIEIVIKPESWVIDNVISKFMMLLNQGNAFAVELIFAPILHAAIRLKSIPD